MVKIIVLAILVSTCGSFKKQKPVETLTSLDLLHEKARLYRSLSLGQLDAFGWLSPLCDGLLFNSLAAVAGLPLNVMAAEEAPGRWRRHPDFSNCRPGFNSKSTISRDMFRGLFIYLLVKKDRDAMVRIREYGEANNWFMGEATDPTTAYGRTWFNPVIRNQLARMIGETESPTLAMAEDYEAHLEVLGIFAEYFIQGFLYAYEIDILHNYAETYPDNALFSALYHAFSDGDQSNAVRILLTEKWFPANRLPQDTDRFTHYLFQRNPGLDWEPCGTEGRPCEGLTHPAIDFHFVYWILTTDFRSL